MFKNRFSRLNTVYGKHGLVWVVIGFLAAGPSASLAQNVPAATAPTPATTSSSNPTSANPPPAPTTLDLSSSDRSISAGAVLGTNSVANIHVGAVDRAVTSIDKLTGAEFFAVQQVLSTSHQQSLLLNSMGAAIGGKVDLTALSSTALRDLVVPTGVSALYNFGQNGSGLNLTGNLMNSGSFYAYSTSNAISTASISAFNIFNQPNALITSILPSSFGINAIGGLSLSLNAINNIVNSGMISSAGNLSAVAGGSIINALPAGFTGMSPIMQAVQNISLQASSILNQGTIASQLATANLATANLTNSGILQALQGSVNVQNLVGNTLTVDGTLGSIRARDQVLFDTLGTVLNADGSVLQKAGIDLGGQSISAQVIKVNSPEGVINIHADRLDGAVDVSGGLAFVGTALGDLNIARMNLTGDPIFYASSGDLTLNIFGGPGGVYSTSGGDFIGLSSGSIIAPGALPGSSIDASSTTKQGGKIDLRAGVAFSVTGGFNPISCDNCTPLYTVFGPSGAGGDINLPNVSLVTNGNSVSLTAFAAGSSTGAITIGNITASGNAQSQQGGIVNISAPGNVSTGNIVSSGFGATGSGGYMNIVSTGGSVTTGLLSNASAGAGGLLNVNASTSVQTQAITTAAAGGGNAGDLFVRAATGDINITGLIATTASGAGNRAGEVTLSTAGNITTADVNLTGSNSAVGGTLTAAGNNVTVGNVTANALGAGGATAGNVSLFAQTNVTTGSISASSATGNAGVLAFAAGNSGTGNISINSLTATGSGAGTVGGHVVSTTPGVTTIGNVDLSSVLGVGGDLTVVSGTSGTSRAAAQSGLLSLGSINTTGASRGGDVIVSNMGTAGNITTTSITTSASGVNARGGSIGMVADGIVTTGNIDTTALAVGSTTGAAGSLFLSSGVGGGTGITTGTVKLDSTAASSNRGGNSFFVVNPAVGVTTGARTQTGGIAGSNFSGTPLTPQSTINSPTTITITPGLVQNYNPGGFT